MSRVLLVCALIVCVLAMPATAGAQEGNGPYAPFPSKTEGGSGDAWYALMDVDVSSARLRDGAFAAGLVPADDRAASARAGVGADGIGPGPLVLALVLLAAGGGAAALLAARRPGPEVTP